jgi:hypothetical protein
MRSDFHAGRTLTIGVAAVAFVAIGLTGLLRCSRDNPLDAKSKSYVPGTPPQARFMRDSLYGLVRDSIKIAVAYSDTEAAGGGTPKVEKLYFSWNGDSGGTAFTDSVSITGNDSVTVTRSFSTERNVFAYVKAKDNDGMFSPPAGMKLVVADTVGPDILFMSHHDGDTVTSTSPAITVMIQTRDPSGILFVYINGASASKLTDTTWPAWQRWQQNVTLTEGFNTITVWSWDKSAGSNQTMDSITLLYRKPDNTPPTVGFVSPQPGDTIRDTLHQSPVHVVVSVSDPSGVAWVKCNDTAMSNPSGNSYTRNVMLKEGRDSLFITAADTKGNNVADTLIVTYKLFRDTVAPYVHINTPQPGEQITANAVTGRVRATDTLGPIRSGIDSVTINRVPAAFGSGYYTAFVALAHGYDTIRVAAADSSGNHAVDSVIVLQNVPPHFYPDIQVKDTILWKDTAATVPFAAVDTENDAIVFAAITFPKINSDSAYLVIDGGGHAHLAGYRPESAGKDTFIVKVTDSYGASDTLKFCITIMAKPISKPWFTISTLPDTAILDSLYSVQLTAKDPNDSPLVYSLLPPTPSGVGIGPATGIVNWTPSALGTDTIVAMVSNGIPESDTLRWVVTAVLRNLPPVLQNPGDKTVDEGQLLQFTLVAADTNGDSLVYSFGSSAPAGATLDSVSGVFRWTPGYRDAGDHTVMFRVTEKKRTPALSDQKTINISVNNINNPPVLVIPGPSNKVVIEDSSINFSLQATDINGDSVRFSMSGAPAGALLDSVSGLFTWGPSGTAAGVYPMAFYAIDNGVPSMRDTVTDTITVVDNTIPVFAVHNAVDTVLVYFPYSTAVSATDGDGDTLRYSVDSAPDTSFHVDSLGHVTWRPPTIVNDPDYTVKVGVIARDHAGNTATLDWEIRVLRWPRIFQVMATNDTGYSVIQTTGGGYAACGTAGVAANGYTWGFMRRTDSAGNLSVYMTYMGSTRHASLYSIQQTRDEGFIMCGTDSMSAGVTKMLLIKTDAAGTVQWTARYPAGAADSSAKGVSVSLTEDGGFIACGAAYRGAAGASLTDAYAVKFLSIDESGFDWQKIYTGTKLLPLLTSSRAFGVQQTSDGGYIISGDWGMLSNGAGDVYLIKTNRAGDTLWTRTYVNNLSARSVGLSVVQWIRGYIIGGYYAEAKDSSVKHGIIKDVNILGDTAGGWTTLFGAGSYISSIRLNAADGDYIACGTVGASSLLYRFAPDGGVIWSSSLGTALPGPGTNLPDLADRGYCAVQSSEGGFIMTGFVTIPGAVGINTDIYLMKTYKTGSVAK